MRVYVKFPKKHYWNLSHFCKSVDIESRGRQSLKVSEQEDSGKKNLNRTGKATLRKKINSTISATILNTSRKLDSSQT